MKLKKYLICVLMTVIFCPLSILSEENLTDAILDGLFKSSDYCQPFVSEFHSTISKVELGYNKSYAEYNLQSVTEKFDRPMIELHVGFEAPLFAYDIKKQNNTKDWSFAATLPLSVHVLEDIFEPVTAAVINTDYRFGAPRFKTIKYLNETGFFKNVSLSWIPIFHECTHLGDEIIIYRKDVDFPITRINVSYEYTELQLTLNDVTEDNKNLHSFRLGATYRISDRGYGWFEVQDEAINVDSITDISKSEKRLEYYAEYQFQRTEGFLASPRFRNILSIDFRSRVRYGYPVYKMVDGNWETTPVKETSSWNINAYLGWKFYAKSESQSLGLFLHYFKGLNPYGQLRNYPGYGFLGLSLTYEP